MARLLTLFGISYRVIHDHDKNSRTPEELATISATDPYAANAKIVETCGSDKVFVIKDTLENILFGGDKTLPKDKPYKCWKRADELANDDTQRNRLSDLKTFVEFAFKW